jgi:hypothetical protein
LSTISYSENINAILELSAQSLTYMKDKFRKSPKFHSFSNTNSLTTVHGGRNGELYVDGKTFLAINHMFWVANTQGAAWPLGVDSKYYATYCTLWNILD